MAGRGTFVEQGQQIAFHNSSRWIARLDGDIRKVAVVFERRLFDDSGCVACQWASCARQTEVSPFLASAAALTCSKGDRATLAARRYRRQKYAEKEGVEEYGGRGCHVEVGADARPGVLRSEVYLGFVRRHNRSKVLRPSFLQSVRRRRDPSNSTDNDYD